MVLISISIERRHIMIPKENFAEEIKGMEDKIKSKANQESEVEFEIDGMELSTVTKSGGFGHTTNRQLSFELVTEVDRAIVVLKLSFTDEEVQHEDHFISDMVEIIYYFLAIRSSDQRDYYIAFDQIEEGHPCTLASVRIYNK